MVCLHSSLRYPALIHGEATCSDCGMHYEKPEWMKRLSPLEIRDVQGCAQLLSIVMDSLLPEDHPDHLTHRKAAQQYNALREIHGFIGREAELQRTFDLVKKIVRGG